MRNFIRYYLFKSLIILALLEAGFILWNQNRNRKPEIIADNYSVFSRQILKMQPLENDIDKN